MPSPIATAPGSRAGKSLRSISSARPAPERRRCSSEQFHDLKSELGLFIIEGDQATTADGDRIRAAGAPCVQVNTRNGLSSRSGHDRPRARRAEAGIGSVVLIENVGNLVCPALFDLGERAKVAILAVTEGEDKPLKYPHMFRAVRVVLLNKIDLLLHLDFDVEKAIANVNKSIRTRLSFGFRLARARGSRIGTVLPEMRPPRERTPADGCPLPR